MKTSTSYSRSPIRQRPDRGRPDRDFNRSDRGGRDGFDGPPRRGMLSVLHCVHITLSFCAFFDLPKTDK